MTTRTKRSLEQWLDWQQTLNPRAIDLGLARVSAVAQRLGLKRPADRVITVGGTNGKGSTVAFLAAMLHAQGFRTGSYTSPHLWRYNERIRLQGEPITDDALCELFERVETARGDYPLTYFEFGTLAALRYFQDQHLDVALLEVGLGGRLDAVNVVDADVAVVVSAGLDHLDWLGPDRDAVGREKAGIARSGRPLVIGEREPPGGLLEVAQACGAIGIRLGTDYDFTVTADTWRWRQGDQSLDGLPMPALRGPHQLQNASAAIAALVAARFDVDHSSVSRGLLEASLAGRYQLLAANPQVILDVAHNAEAAAALATTLAANPVTGRNLALIAMLKDKPVEQIAHTLDDQVDHWFVAGLEDSPRGLSASALVARLPSLQGGVEQHESVEAAYNAALHAARREDRVIVFGSFLTVEKVLRLQDG